MGWCGTIALKIVLIDVRHNQKWHWIWPPCRDTIVDRIVPRGTAVALANGDRGNWSVRPRTAAVIDSDFATVVAVVATVPAAWPLAWVPPPSSRWWWWWGTKSSKFGNRWVLASTGRPNLHNTKT